MHTLIIGGGLTGLMLAHRLQKGGHDVSLLEARENLGGRYRRAGQSFSSPGLDFFAAGKDQLALLEWLKNRSPIALTFQVENHVPQIFDEGKWKPFIGFGETAFQSVSELSALFGHTQHVRLIPGLEQLTRALSEQLPFSAQTMAEVTTLRVKDGKITEAVVNGDKALTAENFIFTGHPTQVNALFEGEDLAGKHRARLAKMQSWSAVTLELKHTPPLAEDDSVRFFASSAKEFEPVVGRVSGETSKWMILVPGDREADHEYTGQCIRHIRRQLKRAWPLALEGHTTGQEKIYVQANVFGQHSLKTKDPYSFPEISNLYLANHALAGTPGELAALEPVRALEADLISDGSNQLPDLSASC